MDKVKEIEETFNHGLSLAERNIFFNIFLYIWVNFVLFV